MKIFLDTEYVDITKQKECWLQLSVVNQWDCLTPRVCFNMIQDNRISYSLSLYTPKGKGDCTCEVIENLTDDMRIVLIELGFKIYK